MDEQLEEELGYEAQSLNHEAQREQVISDLQGHIAELQSENKRLREAMERIKVFSYPGLAVKESTLLNRIYKDATQALKNK